MEEQKKRREEIYRDRFDDKSKKRVLVVGQQAPLRAD
jgi:hypothetical protein